MRWEDYRDGRYYLDESDGSVFIVTHTLTGSRSSLRVEENKTFKYITGYDSRYTEGFNVPRLTWDACGDMELSPLELYMLTGINLYQK